MCGVVDLQIIKKSKYRSYAGHRTQASGFRGADVGHARAGFFVYCYLLPPFFKKLTEDSLLGAPAAD